MQEASVVAVTVETKDVGTLRAGGFVEQVGEEAREIGRREVGRDRDPRSRPVLALGADEDRPPTSGLADHPDLPAEDVESEDACLAWARGGLVGILPRASRSRQAEVGRRGWHDPCALTGAQSDVAPRRLPP